MLKRKINGFIIEEVYGHRKIEDVFKEAYEIHFGVKVKVTCKAQKNISDSINLRRSATA
ncbi:hypothetical protein QRE66_08680 [Bacillus cereus]|nr:hypothetical protein QRE66_08680 [Bacillus cereus]